MENSTPVVAIVQVRLGSSRLPRKALMPIEGKPLLQHIVERVMRAKTVQSVLIATTNDSSDDELAAFCAQQQWPIYRGSQDDVLDRYYRAAQQARAGIVVRVTADDPFKDPHVIDRAVRILIDNPGLDYVANTSCNGSIQPTYPEGLDIEAFTFACLEKTWASARLPSEREHVTPFIVTNPNKFQIQGFGLERDLSAKRWTIDYERDMEFARAVYKRLYPTNPNFGMEDILSLLNKQPDIEKINQGVVRNEGYRASLEKDRQSVIPKG